MFVIPGRGNAASPEPINTGFRGHAHRAWVPLIRAVRVHGFRAPRSARPRNDKLTAGAIDEALAICTDAGVVCGHPHVDASNVEADREGLPLADAAPVAILRRTREGIEGERAEVALFVIPGRGNAASPEPMNTGFRGHAHRAWVP